LTLVSSAHHFGENTKVSAQCVEGNLTGGDVHSPAEIAQGEGAIIRRGLSRLAVHCADKGTLHDVDQEWKPQKDRELGSP
jgi:hypothetical protein